MSLDENNNRRNQDRRIDRIAAQIRLKFQSLKRAIGLDAASRYLARNGYSPASIESLALSKERRKTRRRSTAGPAESIVPSREQHDAPAATMMVAEDIALLYKLRWETDAGVDGLRPCDCPARFSQYGFMTEGQNGAARITGRGREWLLLWTRAKALLDIAQHRGVPRYSDDVQAWLESNRFVSSGEDGLVATARGLMWIETNVPTLTALACST